MNKAVQILKDSGVRIYIPSYRRDKLITVESLDPSLYPFVDIVADQHDIDILQKKYPTVNYLLCPVQGQGLAKVRNWILDQVTADYFFMFDDNALFYKRINDEDPTDFHLKYTNDKRYFDHNMTIDMIYDLITILKEESSKSKCFCVALACRQKSNNATAFVQENERIFACYLMNAIAFRETGVRYAEDKCKVGEDFYVSLSFLTKGYKNLVYYRYCFGKNSANMKGGCSSFRTSQVHHQTMLELKEAFPEFVKIVERTSKNWEGWDSPMRTDVTVSWKEAYQSAFRPKRKTLF